MIITIIKSLEALSFLVALLYSLKNYQLTKTKSNIWLYLSFTMLFIFMLSSVRLVKEFWFIELFEIIQIELIPLILSFLLASAITVRKERGLPVIIPALEPDGMTYCGTSYSNLYLERLAKQKAAATSGKIEKCPVRVCVEEKKLNNCFECPEYSNCSIRKKAIDKCPLFIYKLKKGGIYLKKEETPEGGFEFFVDLLMRGLHGLCLTRINPSKVREKYGIKKTPIAWLTELQNTDELTISPQLELLLHTATDFIDKSGNSVIFFDGLDYLIYHNSFRRVLHFLHRLRDEIAVSDSRLIISINPSTIGEKELKLLEHEADIIEL